MCRQKGLDYACLLTSLRHFDQQTSFLLHRFNLTIAAHTSRLNHAIGEIHSVGHRLQIGLRRFRESSVVALFVLGPWIDPFLRYFNSALRDSIPPLVKTHFNHATDRDTPSARRHSVHNVKLYYVPLFDQGTNMHMIASPYLKDLSPNDDQRFAVGSCLV